MIVKELMSSRICFAKPDATASDAASLMKKYDIGLVPVCDNKGCLLGLVTDRDLVLRSLTDEKREISKIPLSEIMTSEIAYATPDMNIHDAALIFAEKKLRRLPVLENSRLVGILSLSDLSQKKIFLAEVGDIMGSIAKAAR